MDSAAIKQIATEKLGGWRIGARGELRALPRLLHAGERVVTMAMGTLGRRKGRLCVATDERLLLLSKWPLRPVRWESFRQERIRSLRLTPTETGGELRLDSAEGQIKLEMINYQRAEEIARALSPRVDRERVSIEHRQAATGSLSLTACLVGTLLIVVTVATLVATGLWAFEVLAFLPGLAIVAAGITTQFGLRRWWRRVREHS